MLNNVRRFKVNKRFRITIDLKICFVRLTRLQSILFPLFQQFREVALKMAITRVRDSSSKTLCFMRKYVITSEKQQHRFTLFLIK